MINIELILRNLRKDKLSYEYLNSEEILRIHALVIDETGGSHGVRDLNLFESIVQRPMMQFGGQELYVNIFDKAATYFDSCAHHHVFIDGNKRTAISIAIRFLYLNGYGVSIKKGDMWNFVVKAVKNKYSISKIADWLKKHSTAEK